VRGNLVRLHDQPNPYAGSRGHRVWFCHGCRDSFHQDPP
jgi:hypothetical protein